MREPFGETWREIFMSSDDFDRKGYELCEAGDFESALKIYREGIDLFPFTPELHSGKGHMFLYLGEFVQAMQAFRQGLVLSPLDPDLNKGAALALLYLNHTKEALQYLEKARPYFSDDPHSLFELGYALYQVGRYAEAVPYFRDVTALNPGHTDGHLYLGLSLHQSEEKDVGKKHSAFLAAQALAPNRQDIHEHFAHVLFEDGMADEAFDHFERLVPEEVTDETTLERMLEIYKNRRGSRRRRWALRKRLKEVRNSNPVDDFIQELQMDWETGPPPSPNEF